MRVNQSMRTLFFVFTLLLSSVSVIAQVGINTESPQGMLHVDPKGNTSGVTNTEDDVVFSKDGYLGIGTTSPSASIHIKTNGTADNPVSGFRLEDTSQAEDYVLTTDANGLLSWALHAPKEAVQGTRGSGSTTVSISAGQNKLYGINANVTLPPGRWLVTSILFMSTATGTDRTFVMNSTFSDTSLSGSKTGYLANVKSSDIEGPYIISGTSLVPSNSFYGGMLTGSVVINNRSSVNKTYYYVVGNGVLYGTGSASFSMSSTSAENAIVAFRLPDVD